MLRTLFIDFNSYFASVEQQDRPQLRGRPVGVLPVMAETSCCIAASYEAKAFGVKTGTSVREARRLCPEITLLEARPARYVEIHHQAVAAVDRIVPVRQVMSIDEMECELTGRWCAREQAVLLAERVKKEVQSTVGECLRSSIGIAPNTLLGKLASNMQKPNGLTVLELSDIPQGLYHLPPSAINGIGKRINQRLEGAGIMTMEQLYAAPRDLLRTVWRGVAGDDMYDMLRGLYYAPRVSERQSLGHSHVLPPKMRNANDALGVLYRLTQKAAMRLRKNAFFCTGMVVHVQFGKLYHQRIDSRSGSDKRSTRFGQTQDTSFLLRCTEILWQNGLHAYPEPVSVGVLLVGLVPASQHTPSLFDAPLAAENGGKAHSANNSRAQAAPRSREKLWQALDAINLRYGKNALHFASTHHTLNHAPMRIAFSQIPDLESEA